MIDLLNMMSAQLKAGKTLADMDAARPALLAMLKAFGACIQCGEDRDEHHHVVPNSVEASDVTVPLCYSCHGRAHGMSRRVNIRTLTKSAMAHKSARGERVGAVPYGFDLAADGVRLVENADERAIMSAACEIRATGISLRKVSAELASRGMVSRNGRPFGPTQARRLLKGPTS